MKLFLFFRTFCSLTDLFCFLLSVFSGDPALVPLRIHFILDEIDVGRLISFAFRFSIQQIL